MPKKKTSAIRFEMEDALILLSIVIDYKGFVKVTYDNNVVVLAQGKKILESEKDEEKIKKINEALKTYTENTVMLDTAWHRADKLHQALCEFTGEEYVDETNTKGGDSVSPDGDNANESSAEVSENTEVLSDDESELKE